MKIIYSILLSLCGICLFFGCHSEKNKNKLEQAEYLFDACRYDDVLKQLAMISTSSLSEEERMRMAWLQGYTHFRTRSSVLSDTLFLMPNFTFPDNFPTGLRILRTTFIVSLLKYVKNIIADNNNTAVSP